jgi:signal transduction histidine kinase
MSKPTSSTVGPDDPAMLESGLEAFQSTPEFRGPVESVDNHRCNDHVAQIYESNEERFAAAVPFVCHGLERDERVMYVVDESREAEVKSALRDGGIDVDAATDSGALSFHTVQETYLRNGTFEPDEMIEFYGEMVTEATEAYEALRIVAETTWLQQDATTVERFMEYEQKVNELFSETDSLALCQYDRRGFSPAIIRDIVRTHPHLIYDGAVCHNVYYTPPEEFFDTDSTATEVDRMLGTLRDRSAAKAELQRREQFLRTLYEITADPDRGFEAKLDALFELGCEQFGLEFGFLNRVDPDTDHLEIQYASDDDHDHYEVGGELPLSETYCRAAVDIEAAASIADPAAEGYDDLLVYQEFAVDGYLGTYIPVEGGADRTLAFVPGDDSSAESFSEQDRMYIELLGQWIGYELNRRHREAFLRECYEVTADPDRGFEAKLHELLDLACEWTGLEAAGLSYLPEWDGKFLTEYAIGYGEDGDGVVTSSDGLWIDPGEGCFCRQAIESDEPVGKLDVRGTAWEDDQIHQEHDLRCYLGTKVTSGSTSYGTLWVGGTEPRDRPFSDTERMFLELIGQWVGYEVERREHHESQRALYEITADPDRGFETKLDALFDLGCEQFGLDIGGMAKVYPDADQLEVEYVSEEYGEFTPGLEPPLSGTYCGAAYESDAPVTITDPVAEGYDGYAYHELGFEAYLGTHVEVDGGRDRLFFFTTAEPRDRPFSDAETTFIDLLGQWVQYELERRKQERELEETIDRLEESNERLEQFAYAASHDLQEPLRMVSTYLQLIEKRYADKLDEDGREYLDFAVDGADRMRDMIQALLEYSRVDTRGDPFESADLNEVLADVRDDLQMKIDETAAEITAEELPTVTGQLRQLLQNLLDNAIEYSGDEPPRVHVAAERDGNRWTVSVSDEGIGINPDDADRVFDVFQSLHAPDEHDGTGIGLALCERIVERHGGDIWVDSQPDEGATFSFTLSATPRQVDYPD